MNLHIVQDSPFINHFIEVCTQIDQLNNEFIILNPSPYKYLVYNELIKHKTIKEISNIDFISKYRNIYLHGLGGDRFNFIWANYFKFLILKIKKQKPSLIWIFFGNEYYDVVNKKNTIDYKPIKSFLDKNKFRYYNLKHVIQRKIIFNEIDYICHFIPEEVDRIKTSFKLKTKFLPFFYGVNFIYPSENTKPLHFPLKALLGNSATPSNNHIQAAEKLIKLSSINEIIVPLSYGISDYSIYISDKLKIILGSKFIPYYNFINIDKYNALLESIDIGIFNFYRSQGMGNIIQLIILYKPIFLNPKNPAFHYLIRIGVKVGDINRIEIDIQYFDRDILIKNRDIIMNHFSEKQKESNYKSILSV